MRGKTGGEVAIVECNTFRRGELHHGRQPSYTSDFPDFFCFLEVLAISPDPGGRVLVTKVPPSLAKQSALQELLQ